MMCRVLTVSSSGYYAWRTRAESQRERDDRELTRVIRRVHAESDGTYGSPRMHLDLKAAGYRCGRAKVGRLMRQAGLKGCPKRRFRVTGGHGTAPAANLLAQNFSAARVNERWASDITFIWTGQSWLYLAVVMDLYSRRIVGWSMSRRINRHLVVNALNMALGHRRPDGGLIHHSDRGAQYLSDDFQTLLKAHGILCSVSDTGSCYDNAVVESFFATLKRERIKRRKNRTATKHVLISSTTSSGSTIASAAMAIWEISARHSMRTEHQGLNETVHETRAKPIGHNRPFEPRT
jgi:transposase InsO family protein